MTSRVPAASLRCMRVHAQALLAAPGAAIQYGAPQRGHVHDLRRHGYPPLAAQSIRCSRILINQGMFTHGEAIYGKTNSTSSSEILSSSAVAGKADEGGSRCLGLPDPLKKAKIDPDTPSGRPPKYHWRSLVGRTS
ncbi:hypothetical protein B0H14DRAFT_2618997 [Mycena olivaceomarginata]|nr:hypothetical protein B0H14DRAFT_2618997 [Mycena olivaceomarginata]